MNQLKFNLNYKWVSVLREEGDYYVFPQKISQFMKDNYRSPQIYRWNIFKNNLNDEKIVYIGEAQIFCPTRLQGYIKPGPSQYTNIRMNKEFEEFIKKGYSVALEILDFEQLTLNELKITKKELHNKFLRKFVENLMLFLSRHEGYHLLNK